MDGRVAIYDSNGVSGCRLAMDELSKRFPVDRFIVMGNCAAANVSFNTALVEPRVAGMILTNPHVNELQTAGIVYKKKALQLEVLGQTAVRPKQGSGAYQRHCWLQPTATAATKQRSWTR